MPPDIVITLRADDLTSAAFQEVKQQLLELGRVEARVNQDSEKLLIARRRHLQALAEARTANANARIAGEGTERAAIEQETAFRQASSRETLANLKAEEDARRRGHQTNQTAIRNEEAARRRSHQTSQTAIRNEEAERKRAHQTNQTAIRNEESAKRRAHQTNQTAIRNEEAANRRSHQSNQTAIRAEQAERNRAHQVNQTAIRNEESARRRVHQANISNTNAEIARDRIAAQNRSLDLREQTLAERRLDRERRDSFGSLRNNQERVRRGFLSWETLLSHIGSIIAFEIVFQVANLARHVVDVSAEFERLRLGLQAINQDPFTADSQIRRIRELAELPGVGFASGLRSITSLRGAGITFNQAERLLREISNVASLSGATQEDVGEALRQFRQVISAGEFTQQDLRPILQRIPLLQPAFLDAFGSIQAGGVNEAIEAQGITIVEAFDRLLVRLEAGPRADPETFTNAMERLRDSFDDLARDFGSDLLPTLKRLVDALNRFFQFLRTPTGRSVLAGGVGAIGGAFTGAAISLSRSAGGLAGLGIGSALGSGGIGFFPAETGESRRLHQLLRSESAFNRYTFQERIRHANEAAQLAEHRRLQSIARAAGQEFPYTPEEIGSPLGYLQQRRAALATSPNRFVRGVATPLPGFISGAILGGTTAAFGQYAVTAAQRVNRGEDVNILDRFTSFIGGGGFGTPGLSQDVFRNLFANQLGISADTITNLEQVRDILARLSEPASATVRFTKSLEELRKELAVAGDVADISTESIQAYNQSRIAFERTAVEELEGLEQQRANVNAEIRRLFRSGRLGEDGQPQYIRRYDPDAEGTLEFILEFRNRINRLRQSGVELDETYDRILTEGLVEELTKKEQERLEQLIEERKVLDSTINSLNKSIGAGRREADEIDEQLGEDTTLRPGFVPRPVPNLDLGDVIPDRSQRGLQRRDLIGAPDATFSADLRVPTRFNQTLGRNEFARRDQNLIIQGIRDIFTSVVDRAQVVINELRPDEQFRVRDQADIAIAPTLGETGREVLSIVNSVRDTQDQIQSANQDWERLNDTVSDYTIQLERLRGQDFLSPDDVYNVRDTRDEINQLIIDLESLQIHAMGLDAFPEEVISNITVTLNAMRDASRVLTDEIDTATTAMRELREEALAIREQNVELTDLEFEQRFPQLGGAPPTREQIFNHPFFRRQRERQQQREQQRAQAFAGYFENAAESLYDRFIAPSILDAVGIGSGQSAAQERAIENLTRSVEEARREVREDETLNARQQAEQQLEITREYEREKREIERSYEEERSDAWRNWVRQQLTDFPKLLFEQLKLQLAARTTNSILNALGVGTGGGLTLGSLFGGGGSGVADAGGIGQAANLAGRFARLRAGTGQAIGTAGQAAGYAGVAYSGYQAARGVYEVARGGGYDDLVSDIGRIPSEIGSFFSGLHFNNPFNDELARVAGFQRAQNDAYNLGRQSAHDIVMNYDRGYSEGTQPMQESSSTGNTYVISGDTNFNMPIEIGDREIRQISFTMDEMMSDRRI